MGAAQPPPPHSHLVRCAERFCTLGFAPRGSSGVGTAAEELQPEQEGRGMLMERRQARVVGQHVKARLAFVFPHATFF